MSLNSINTNVAAMIALQNLAGTQTELGVVQNRINTGLKIASAKDNGAIWAIAQTQKAQASSLDAVTNSLNNAKSTLDTTLQAGTQLTDILTQMKSKALAASDATIDDTSRSQYAAEFAKLAQSYANTIASASFNGVNLLDGGSGSVSALGSSDGSVTVSSSHTAVDLNSLFTGSNALTITAGSLPSGAGTKAPFSADTVTMTANAWTGTTAAADAAADMALVDTALTTVTAAMSGFGVDSKAVDNQLSLVSKLQDSLMAGVGNLVDANLAQESARLQALQTKQQLGVQALAIANQSTGILLGLFR